ncbi:MAG: GNAT family N-acetyltransferase [Verrucomicrobiia bacterium]
MNAPSETLSGTPARAREPAHPDSACAVAARLGQAEGDEEEERRRSCAIEEITDLAGLERLEPEWETLWNFCPTATPFQSPAWLISWWRHFGYGELWTLVVRHQGRLVGLLPVHRHTGKVTFLGTGISDYLDALVAPGFEQTVTRAFFSHLMAHSRRWAVCDFQQMKPRSPLLSFRPGDLKAQISGHDPCPVLELPRTPADLPSRVPEAHLAKVAYGWRRAAKIGRVQTERATKGSFDSLMQAFLTLHGSRWSERGETGVLAAVSLQSFHRESGAALLRQGKLRLYVLRIDSEPVAALYGFLHQRTFFYYLGGFDPKFRVISPGSLIIHHALMEAVDEGALTFDFLRGREPYKYTWGAKDMTTLRLRVAQSG